MSVFSRPSTTTVVALCFALPAFAVSAPTVAANNPSSQLENAELSPIVVTATRQLVRADETLATITVISREEIERAGTKTLAELLALTPGVQIVQNGGPGASTSVFLRGAEARHTLLLIDGVRVSSATSGQATFEALPLELIERIEILRGPASALYGSEAIGGVIHVITRRGRAGFAPTVSLGAGSQGSVRGAASVSGGDERLTYAVSAAHERTDGIDAQNGKLGPHSPDHDAFRLGSGVLHLGWQLSPEHHLWLNTLAARGRNEYDTTHGWPPEAETFDSYLNKDLTSAQVTWQARWREGLTSTLRLASSQDELTNRPNATSRSHFDTTQHQVSFQLDAALPVGNALLAFDHLRQAVDSTTAYTVRSRTIDAVVLGWWFDEGAHSAQLNLRHDDNSQFGHKNTWHAAYGYRLTPQWQVRAAASTAFNAPTFNQLYWPDTGFGGGNPHLRPEKARHREVGLRWQGDAAQAELTLFDNRVRDLIAGWPPSNVSRARLKGVEASTSWRWQGWQVRLTLDWLEAKDRDTGQWLPRRSRWSGSASLAYAQGAWQYGLDINAQDRRWDNTANTRRLGGYGRTDLWVQYALARDWRWEARLANAFDKRYETAYGYHQPGRTLFVGVRYLPR